jgi:hypothetical protein
MPNSDIRTSPWIISLDASDTLWINLSKHAFEGFGLEGYSTEKKRIGIDRYVVKVNLRDEKITKSDSKYRARVVSCLDRLSTSPIYFTAVFDSEAAQSAFAKVFTKQQVSIKKSEISNFEKIFVPAFPNLNFAQSDLYDFVEMDLWAGSLFSGCQHVLHQKHTDPFISVCTFDQDSCCVNDVNTSELDGPVHPRLLLEWIKSLLHNKTIVLRVLGSPNAVVTWDDYPNRIDDRRDSCHGYLLVMQSDSDNCAILQYASCDLRKP